MSLIIRRNVKNWYNGDILLVNELLSTFVSDVENQVNESILRYREDEETYIIDEDPSIGYSRVVDHHQGLEDETWDLKHLFEEYFPSLQRRSALITLVGYFEHTLNDLCNLFQTENHYQFNLKDIKGNGISRATKYLNKAAGLNVHRTSTEWQEIMNIQKFRNCIVHVDGNLHELNQNDRTSITTYINQNDSLDGENNLVIKHGYLDHVLCIYMKYFSLLNDSISTVGE